MPITYRGRTARLAEECRVEEAGDLLDWLRGEEGRQVDLARCTALHTSVLQVLLATRCAVVAAPRAPLLARWLTALLPAPSQGRRPAARTRGAAKTNEAMAAEARS